MSFKFKPASRGLATMGAALLVVGVLAAAGTVPAVAASVAAPGANAEKPRNVILLIGDGMGDSEITVARNYEHGAAGAFPGIDALPVTGSYTTYSLHRSGPYQGLPDYVPDSAATGTAWSTGYKTYDGAIGVDLNGTGRTTLIEAARAAGLRTGNVSTAEIQDATPAVQIAHVANRKCYGPEDAAACGSDLRENGGLGSISEQLLDSRADVTLGGGAASFNQKAQAGPYAGLNLWDQAEQRGYQIVRTAAELDQVSTAGLQSPVLGLFTEGNFPTRYASTEATAGGADQPPITCQPNSERLDQRLSLAALTDKAIELLDTPDSAPGFFLQIEGASIDKRDHAADACGQIGETADLDEAVQVALEFAQEKQDTLVIVSADHAHTSQIVDDVTPGLSIALMTKDGAPMKVSYGTAEAGGSQQHTGAQVRVGAYGPGSDNFHGLTDQSDVFRTVTTGLGLEPNLVLRSSEAALKLPNSTVTAGASAAAQVAGFHGDKTVQVTVGEAAPIVSDALGGPAQWTVAAPTQPGTYTVT
ncbi:MAG: alkaline phosphatase, partial [Bifidobacteriaceae bacterium]|nr:alkaline phosphatase [Bifidobacteriaceae bacterium]